MILTLEKGARDPLSRRDSCNSRLISLIIEAASLRAAFKEIRKLFRFSEPKVSIAEFGRFCHEIPFFALQRQLAFSFPRESAFRERALFSGAVNDRSSVDYFTALSIAAHSCLSSPEQVHLLITMGLFFCRSVNVGT